MRFPIRATIPNSTSNTFLQNGLTLFLFFQPVIINRRGHLASIIAKFILNGNKVVVVRCEGINMSGNFYKT